MGVTERQMRAATWTKQFEHKEFRAYTNELVPALVLLHDNGVIRYRVKGHGETDSLSQAVRWVNRDEKQSAGREFAPGSPQSIKARKGALPGR